MIVIVDYGMGNVASVKNALASLGHEASISDRPEDFSRATHIILPGVGAFPDGMEQIQKRGLVGVLTREVLEKKKPFLGICLGMQLMAQVGEEAGGARGLGWIAGVTRRLRVGEENRLPHIGWNDVAIAPRATLFRGITSPVFYFVHSYALEPDDSQDSVATCTYGETFAVAVEKENIFGVQFHPEKSQKSGLAVLENFITYHA